MCDAISGGGNLPAPMQNENLAPAKGAEVQPAGGGATSATTPTGPAAVGATLLGGGPGSLGAVLTSLVAALKSLVAALGGAPVAGGGSTDATQQPTDVFSGFGSKIDMELGKLPVGDPRRAELESLRPRIDQLRAKAARVGAVSQGDAMLLGLDIRIAGSTGERRQALEQLRPHVVQLTANANASGTTDQLALLTLDVRIEIAAADPADASRVAQLTALHQKIAQEHAATTSRGSVDPLVLQSLAEQFGRLTATS